MSRSTILLCPGRGSYTASELGYLSRPAPGTALDQLDAAVARSDGLRTARGDLTIRGMDGAKSFDPTFFSGENANGLTFACTAFDFLRLDAGDLDVVAVGGNSMGWYSALYIAGVFELDDAFDLVETMGAMNRGEQVGGQIVYPLLDEDWHPDEDAAARIESVLRETRNAGHAVGWSIRYGGNAVLWGDEEGARKLLAGLPETRRGARKYPLPLRGHSAFHSPLMHDVSRRAFDQLSGLPWRAPAVPLIDGQGVQWGPITTDPGRLCAYTLGTQVTETFDFNAMVRVCLREYAPEMFVLLGPGDTLGAAVAQVVIAERWQGIASRRAFVERQESDPFLVSVARPEQAARVLLPPD